MTFEGPAKMTVKTLAILMPGDMGHGCGIAFRESGYRVVTNLVGRSERTKGLGAKAQIEDLGSFEEVAKQADLVLSILPPENAVEQARIFADAMIAAGSAPPYVDCNAIAPSTSLKVAGEIARAGGLYIDGGIIGNNPITEKGGTRLYVSGPDTSMVEELDGKGMVVRNIGDEIGRASGMKMVYASSTKGTFSLHAAVLTTAHAMGLTEEYLKELSESQPAMLAAMERMIPRIPLDAARWRGEMHEIAATFAEAGVTPKFHQGAADMMALADRTPIALETRETVDQSRTLLQALHMYVAARDDAKDAAE
jgi:3-hydroxyisobutyrate dehydrogenase-like beta-hydroxyacid dehydrogenase